MAQQLYGYNNTSTTSYGGGGGVPASLYSSSTSLTDPYIPVHTSRYLISDQDTYSRGGGGAALPFATPTLSHLASHTPQWLAPPGVDVGSAAATAAAAAVAGGGGIKRSSAEALYHHNILGAHNSIGQTEAWFPTNPLGKRPRFESASNLPIYPQRPGEKDCAHYMLTRTCRFGDTCKFDHPIWVPEGGIPDWKEVPLTTTSELLPERAGEPDCPYFVKTQRCKFGMRCKFNHPKDAIAHSGVIGDSDVSALPERPSEPLCAFYMKTGKCKFGATCKFHHPKDIQIPAPVLENGSAGKHGSGGDARPENLHLSPPLMHNSKGLPIRPDEVDCVFYLKTGSCKYGTICRYNHPDRNSINPPPAAAVAPAFIPSPATHLNIGVVNPAASIWQTFDPRVTQTPLGIAHIIYPQRPGQIECDYYMKTGECKFGDKCKFHHPIDRSVTTVSAKETQQQHVKLSLAGLPRREGAIHCPYYMKTGTCKYGATCKFDHPPPGEVMAMATQGATVSGGAEVEADEKGAETVEAMNQ